MPGFVFAMSASKRVLLRKVTTVPYDKRMTTPLTIVLQGPYFSLQMHHFCHYHNRTAPGLSKYLQSSTVFDFSQSSSYEMYNILLRPTRLLAARRWSREITTESIVLCTSLGGTVSSHPFRPVCAKTSFRNITFAVPKSTLVRNSSSLTRPSDDMPPTRPKRIVVGITGATGAVYAIRLLEVLRDMGVETHLIMSKWALATLQYETDLTEQHIRGLSHTNYTGKDLSAPISSGSFQHDGMIIVPCSMKTLAAVRIGYCDDLIARSADVTLKEGRKLVMVVRETPLSDIHLENMLFLRRAGAVIFPPVPAFYTKPQGLADMVEQSVGRMLDCFSIHTDGFKRWSGFERARPSNEGTSNSG